MAGMFLNSRKCLLKSVRMPQIAIWKVVGDAGAEFPSVCLKVQPVACCVVPTGARSKVIFNASHSQGIFWHKQPTTY